MRRGRQAKFRAGLLLPWTRAPYGYRLDPDRPRDPAGVRVDPAEAAIVAALFTSYLEAGQSLFGLAKDLMAHHMPTPSGKPRWNHATIRGILHNPVYTGHVYAGRTRARPARTRHSAMTPIGLSATSYVLTPPEDWILVAHIPPMVSQEQFELVQAKLSLNQQFATRNNKAHDYLLRALVSCGRCRAACWARMGHPAYGYYICRGKMHPIHSGRDERCPSRFIPAQPLDELVWRDLCEILTHPEAIAQALQRAQGDHWLPQDLQARREQLRKGRVSLNQQLERLTEAYLEGVIPLVEYQRRRHELEQRLQALDSQAQQLEASVDRHVELAALVASMEDFCQRVRRGLARATFVQKRQLVELLIDRVVVTNEEVEIRYVIPTSPKSEQVRFCHLRKDYFNPTAPFPGPDQTGSCTGCHLTEQVVARLAWFLDDDHGNRPVRGAGGCEPCIPHPRQLEAVAPGPVRPGGQFLTRHPAPVGQLEDIGTLALYDHGPMLVVRQVRQQLRVAKPAIGDDQGGWPHEPQPLQGGPGPIQHDLQPGQLVAAGPARPRRVRTTDGEVHRND